MNLLKEKYKSGICTLFVKNLQSFKETCKKQEGF